MRSEGEYQRAVELIRAGVNDCEVGRRLTIPRGTIRDWRLGLTANSVGRTRYSSVEQRSTCFRCESEEVDEQAYAYLLGVYLGDGWLSSHARGVFRLRIACDLKYTNIINEIATRMVIVRRCRQSRLCGSSGMRRGLRLLEALAMCVSPAWSRPQARATNSSDAVAEGNCGFSTQSPRPWAHSLGRKSACQRCREAASFRGPPVSVPEIYVHQRLHRYFGDLHRCPRLTRCSLDTNHGTRYLSGSPKGRCLPRHLHRSEELTNTIPSARECWNGRQYGLKHHCLNRRVGSNPTSRTLWRRTPP